MQQTLLTNQDIYAQIIAFEEQFGGALLPSLEAYLRSLWHLIAEERPSLIDAGQLIIWLEQAFLQKPPEFQVSWYDYLQPAPLSKLNATFADWESVILFQIADLKRMEESGDLACPERYCGITSPSGTRWTNFDPITYLECAVRGTMGGYQPFAAVAETSSNKQRFFHSVFLMSNFTWADMILLAKFGQMYA